VTAVEDRFLARRYNEMDAHPEIAVLTGQAIDPYALVEPVIVVRSDLQKRKIVGTLFGLDSLRQLTGSAGSQEFLAVDDPSEYWALLNGAHACSKSRAEARNRSPISPELLRS